MIRERAYLSSRQVAMPPPPRGGRRGNSLGGAVVRQTRYTVGAQVDQLFTSTRYPGDINDTQIVKDKIPWYPTEGRSGVGTAEVDWTADGPYRPELNIRDTSWRVMAGTSNTRYPVNPLDPNSGLHTNPLPSWSGNAARAADGAYTMKHGRTDRLSPARYTGQTYSQTTLLQGAPGTGRRRHL